MTPDDDADRLIETLEEALEAAHMAKAQAEADFAARIEAARQHVDRWREAAEVEHGACLRMEAERDALMSLIVHATSLRDQHYAALPYSPVGYAGGRLADDGKYVFGTQEAAVAAVRKAAGLEDQP